MMLKNLRSVVAQIARLRKSAVPRRNFCWSRNPTTETKEAVGSVVRDSVLPRRNFSPSPNPTNTVNVSKDPGDSIALRVGHGLLFGAGFFVAGPLLIGDPVAEVEQTRQQSAKLVCGESAVIGDMRERMWTDLRGRICSFVAGKSQSS